MEGAEVMNKTVEEGHMASSENVVVRANDALVSVEENKVEEQVRVEKVSMTGWKEDWVDREEIEVMEIFLVMKVYYSILQESMNRQNRIRSQNRQTILHQIRSNRWEREQKVSEDWRGRDTRDPRAFQVLFPWQPNWRGRLELD